MDQDSIKGLQSVIQNSNLEKVDSNESLTSQTLNYGENGRIDSTSFSSRLVRFPPYPDENLIQSIAYAEYSIEAMSGPGG